MVVACEGQNARKGAGQLDLQLAIDRYQANSLDQAADGSRGFFTKLGAVQLLMQPGGLVTIDLGQVVMEPDSWRRTRAHARASPEMRARKIRCALAILAHI